MAKGKDYYDQVISGEEPFPEPLFIFEELLYMAENAYVQRYGTPLKRLPAVNYESRTNEEAWVSQKSAA